MGERKLPAGWAGYKLSDLSREKITDGTHVTPRYTKTGIPFISVNNLKNGKIDFSNCKFISKEEHIFLTKRCNPEKGDILISKVGTLGLIALIPENLDFNIFVQLALIKPKYELVDSKFLYYLLRTSEIKRKITAFSNESTMRYIGVEKIGNIELSLPPLPIQRQIVAVLEQAEVVKRQREEADALTGALLQSVFREIFGDPVRNERGWEITTFGNCCRSIRYGVGMPPQYTDEGIPFVRATNIKKGTITEKNLKYVSSEDSKTIEKCRIKEGNLIVVRSGVNTGDSAYVPKKFEGALAGFDLIVEFDKLESAQFFNFLINTQYGKAQINLYKRRAAQEHLNSEQLSSLNVPNPPLALQRQFARVVLEVERIQEQQVESKREIDVLFEGLMAGTFKGEIVA